MGLLKKKPKIPKITSADIKQDVKKMNRREFIKLLGKAALAATGAKFGLSLLENEQEKKLKEKEKESLKREQETKKRLEEAKAKKIIKRQLIKREINEKKILEFENQVKELRKKFKELKIYDKKIKSKEKEQFFKQIKDVNYINNLATLIAESLNVEPKLVLAIIRVESSGQRIAISSKKAFGLMQLLPSTEKDIFKRKLQEKYGKKIFEEKEFGLFIPHYNIYLGTIYLKSLYFEFLELLENRIKDKELLEEKALEFAIKAYNAGKQNVIKKLYLQNFSFLDTSKIYPNYHKAVENELIRM